jgi:hypothetical protein
MMARYTKDDERAEKSIEKWEAKRRLARKHHKKKTQSLGLGFNMKF